MNTNTAVIRGAAVAALAAVVLAGCKPLPEQGTTPERPVSDVVEVWGENIPINGQTVPYFYAKCDANGEPYDVKPMFDAPAKAAARRACKEGN